MTFPVLVMRTDAEQFLPGYRSHLLPLAPSPSQRDLLDIEPNQIPEVGRVFVLGVVL